MSHNKNLVIDDNLFKSNTNITNTNTDMVSNIDYIIKDMELHLKSSMIKKSYNWVLYKDNWLALENKGSNGSFYNYNRGDIIILLDLGTTNMGTEIRFPHPCVVLYDNKEDWVIVAPITGAQIDKTTQKHKIHKMEVFIPKTQNNSDKNYFEFKKDCVVQIDQLRRVSKHRCIDKRIKKIKADILNEIDNKILLSIIPKKNDLLNKIKEKLNDVESENEQLKRENEQLKRENEQLKQKK